MPAEQRELAGWPDGARLFAHLRYLRGPLRLADLSGYVRSLGIEPAPGFPGTLQGRPMRHRGTDVGNLFLAEKADGDFQRAHGPRRGGRALGARRTQRQDAGQCHAGPRGRGLVRSVVATVQDLAPLEEIERMRTEFLSLAGHELCAPLTAIKGSAVTLLEDAGPIDRPSCASSATSMIACQTVKGSDAAELDIRSVGDLLGHDWDCPAEFRSQLEAPSRWHAHRGLGDWLETSTSLP